MSLEQQLLAIMAQHNLTGLTITAIKNEHGHFFSTYAHGKPGECETGDDKESVAAATTKAIRKLNERLAGDEDSADLLSMEQVEGLIGRKADGPGVEEDGGLKVSYTWKGVFRSYPLTAVYTKQSPPKLLRIQ